MVAVNFNTKYYSMDRIKNNNIKVYKENITESKNSRTKEGIKSEIARKYNANVTIGPSQIDEKSIFAQALQGGKSGGYGKTMVGIPNELLEKMTKDENVYREVNDAIQNHVNSMAELNRMISMSGDQVIADGISFDKDGNWVSWSMTGPTPKQQAENARKQKAHEKEKADKKEEEKMRLKLYYQNGQTIEKKISKSDYIKKTNSILDSKITDNRFYSYLSGINAVNASKFTGIDKNSVLSAYR